MHMQNELLSLPVAAGTIAVAAVSLGSLCRKAGKALSSQTRVLMGLLGAFVFAAQMVNFPLPLMPGTSGHMVGAVLLAIILGPNQAAITLASVVIIQCLVFQDGGLIALGCNIINIAIVPSYVGYYMYRLLQRRRTSPFSEYLSAVFASIAALAAGAVLVPIQAALSGVLLIPFHTFLFTMLAVHLLIGLIEGIITASVIAYIRKVRPDILHTSVQTLGPVSSKAFYCMLIISIVIIAAGLSLFASDLPDGLEWSYKERPDQPAFERVIKNPGAAVVAADRLQQKYSPMPDYTLRAEAVKDAPAWQSFAGIAGSALTMGLVWLTAFLLRKTSRSGGNK
ncbi:MAG: energy-coupling factor ABC transporter permease [Planctomycetota bacterium]